MQTIFSYQCRAVSFHQNHLCNNTWSYHLYFHMLHLRDMDYLGIRPHLYWKIWNKVVVCSFSRFRQPELEALIRERILIYSFEINLKNNWFKKEICRAQTKDMNSHPPPPPPQLKFALVTALQRIHWESMWRKWSRSVHVVEEVN